MNVQLVLTGDGSHTLAVPSMDEHYHSIHGAVSESGHIFINAGLKYALQDKKKIRILEIGFGTGLNALLTFVELSGEKIFCEYTGIELYPVPEEIYSKLNYPAVLDIPDKSFLALHRCDWNEKIRISDFFSIYKIQISARNMKINKSYYDLVYFDAFGPDKQPEMWTEEVFRKISDSLKMGGILTTYSTKGSVKRIVKASGFSIEKLPGPAGKREILRAVKFQ
ncbi:MAG: tRNA (5-methylaminomethyl-2-thiouridine)(34)-methyltransferase MnmD [Bacteroidota bacterium]